MLRKALIGGLISIFTFLGCQTAQEKFLKKHNVLYAKTNEFDEFITKAKIKPNDARRLVANYIHENNLKGLGGELFFIIDGHYTYTIDIQPKLPAANTRGIWMNAENGNVKHVKEGILLKVFKAYDE